MMFQNYGSCISCGVIRDIMIFKFYNSLIITENTAKEKEESLSLIHILMVCQNDSQTQSLLPPEQLQQEEQKYWKDYEYLIQMLPMVVREVWIVADALLDRYEYAGSSIYSEYQMCIRDRF